MSSSVLTLDGHVGVVAHALVDPAVVRDHGHLVLIGTPETCKVLQKRGMPHIRPVQYDRWAKVQGMWLYLLKSNFAAGACMVLCDFKEGGCVLHTLGLLYTRMWWTKRTLASLLQSKAMHKVREVRLDTTYAQYHVDYAYDQLPRDLATVGAGSGGRLALIDTELRYQHLYAPLKFRASVPIRGDPRHVSQTYTHKDAERIVVRSAGEVPPGYFAFRVDDACFLVCRRKGKGNIDTAPYRGKDGVWRVFYPRHTLGPGVRQMEAYLATALPDARVVGEVSH